MPRRGVERVVARRAFSIRMFAKQQHIQKQLPRQSRFGNKPLEGGKGGSAKMMDGGLMDRCMEILSKNSRYRTPSLPEVVFLCFVIGRHIHIYISVYMFASRGGLVRVAAVAHGGLAAATTTHDGWWMMDDFDEAVTYRGEVIH